MFLHSLLHPAVSALFLHSCHISALPSVQVDGKVVDGLLGDANGVEPPRARVKNTVKWQKPRFSRKALMKCCLVRWIIASTQPQDKGERHDAHRSACVDWQTVVRPFALSADPPELSTTGSNPRRAFISRQSFVKRLCHSGRH